MAVAALVLGILSAVLGFVPFLGMLLGITAVILSAIFLGKKPTEKKGLAIAGLVTGIVGVVWGLLSTIAFFTVMSLGGAALNAINSINSQDLQKAAEDLKKALESATPQ